MTHFPSFEVFRSFLANFDDTVEVLLFKSILRYTITHEIHPDARKHEFMDPKCHFRPQKHQKYRFSENPDFRNLAIFWHEIPPLAPKFDFLKILVNSLGDYLLPEPFLIIFRYSKLLKLYSENCITHEFEYVTHDYVTHEFRENLGFFRSKTVENRAQTPGEYPGSD